MNILKVTGKFLGHSAVETVGKNNTKVRKIWIDMTTNPEYKNTPQFEMVGDKVVLSEGLKKDDNIVLSFNLSGRKWEKEDGRKGVSNSLNVYKIEKMTTESVATANLPVATPDAQAAGDDLPF